MKTEINLRTREFTIAREFYLPRFLATLAVIGLLALVLGGTVFIFLYQMRLGVEYETLLQEKEALQVTVAPLEEIEARIRGLERREILMGSLESSLPPWSDSCRKIYRIAQENGPRVLVLNTGDEGMVNIEGESPSMRQAALFAQALEKDSEGSVAVNKYMIYSSNDNLFSYQIELTMADGGEQ